MKKDKNGNEILIGDNVKIDALEFSIVDFKLRSYGWVALNNIGEAYECSYLEKIIPEEEPKKEKLF